MTQIRLAVLVDDVVVAVTDDLACVRVGAAMIASSPTSESEPVFRPIERGRRASCQLIAMGES